MTNLQHFSFKGNKIRITVINDEPWFIAKDICELLTIKNVSDAMTRLDDDERRLLSHDQVIGLSDDPDTTKLLAVSESGMYALALSSRKPEVKPFRKWVTNEVLPTIRKTGQYSASDYNKYFEDWRKYERNQFTTDTNRINLRNQLKKYRSELNDTINNYFKAINKIASPRDFAQVADAINVALTGETSKEMKTRTNLEGNKLIADYMPESALSWYSTTVTVTTNLILNDKADPLKAVAKAPKIALPKTYQPQIIEFVDPLVAAENRIDLYLSGQLSLPWVR